MQSHIKHIVLFLLVVFALANCGGFKSVEKLEKIKEPKSLPEALEARLKVSKLPAKPVKKVVQKKKKPSLSAFQTPEALKRKAYLKHEQAFEVGEKTTMSLKWFAIKGGEITLEVLPFVEINGRKTFHFKSSGKSSSIMDLIHSIDDSVDTYVDAETFYPIKSKIEGIETDRLRKGFILFDYLQMKLHYWMKRVHVKKGVKEKNRVETFTPGLLDMFTSIYYLRALPLEVGKTYETELYNNGKIISVKLHVLRKEILVTEIGDFHTLVVRPEARFQGILKMSGDSLIWVTDDPRHFILQLVSKVKIGRLFGRIIDIQAPTYTYPSMLSEEDSN